MGTLTIRNLDDEVITRLKQQAKTNHRSLEAQVREVLSETTRQKSNAEFLAEVKRIAAMTPKTLQTDSTDLLREDRER